MYDMMAEYLDRDTRSGWLQLFATKHWVAPVHFDSNIRVPISIVNRTTKSTPFIAVCPMVPRRLLRMLENQLSRQLPMIPMCIGEPQGDPDSIASTLATHGLWIDPDSMPALHATLFQRLGRCVIAKAGIFKAKENQQTGIYSRLLMGTYPGARYVGPAVQVLQNTV